MGEAIIAIADNACPAGYTAAGDDLQICEGETVNLDGSASTTTCRGSLEYRWLEGAQVICDWSTSPTCDVAPVSTTVYTLEVRCVGSCVTDSDDVLVEVVPAIIPRDLGNSVRAAKQDLTNLVLSWSSVPEAVSYTLHRGIHKGVWPSPPFRQGVAGTTETLPDVPRPPDLYFYRVAGVNCAGVEGP